jgi:hypothetical protein
MSTFDDDAAELAAMRRRKEEMARTMTFMRQPYAAEDMLIAREPNEAGYYASHPYHGGSFDESRFRLIRAGWDHDHCFICTATIKPGDEWWAAAPRHEVGLCLVCHDRLFGEPKG